MSLDLDAIERKARSLASDFGYADSPPESAREVARDAVALVAEVKRLRDYADEMERQRNAYGAALSRAADGESAVEMAAEAMLELWGAE